VALPDRSGAGPALGRLVGRLVEAGACWSPTLPPDGEDLAYVSDRSATPALWIRRLGGGDRHVPVGGDEPVVAVRWSPDGAWLACALAPGSGVRTEVWVLRPDGSGVRRVGPAGDHCELGPWSRTGHGLTVTLHGGRGSTENRCVRFDPETGSTEPLCRGALLSVLDCSADDRFLLVRDGPRGAERCWVRHQDSGRVEGLLPFPGVGATEGGLLRPGHGPDGTDQVVYLMTDAGLARRGLVAVPLSPDGRRGPVGTLAQREDAELELLDADDQGRLLLLVWNVGGKSRVELLDPVTGATRPVPDLPGSVVHDGLLSRDGRRAVLSVEGPSQPRRLFNLDVATMAWAPLTPSTYRGPALPPSRPLTLSSHDGLTLEGWHYRAAPPPGRRAPPALVWLHGGPEAQERPGFQPVAQLLAEAGISVFTPNIRGSSGYGRAFGHADDRFGRLDAIGDVAACGAFLVDQGLADPSRLAVAGRSYGGYATLMALATHPGLFRAGVDICGMSDLLTFYRDTEDWIAQAAVSKYGDPVRDRWFLARVSPLRAAQAIDVPLLVVHGELDTNVPVGESRQLVARLRGLGHPVDYLELAHEGHEFRRAESRRRLYHTMVEFLSRALDLDPGSGPR
jgi:acetyl esterase/lipase